MKINKINENENILTFEIDLEGDLFVVEVEKDYWKYLTNGKISPEELVKESFEFLLEREPKEAILKKFNLKVINKYFPEYENTIIIQK